MLSTSEVCPTYRCAEDRCGRAGKGDFTAACGCLGVIVAGLIAVACGGSPTKSASTTRRTSRSTKGGAATTRATKTQPTATPDPCQMVSRPMPKRSTTIPLQDGVKSAPTTTRSALHILPNGPIAQIEIGVGDGAKNVHWNVDRALDHEFDPLTDLATRLTSVLS